MKNKKFGIYWLFLTVGVLAASFYPLYMGYKVISDMIINGTVFAESYPKYIIPYTPIAISLICGVLIMPIAFKLCKKYAFIPAAVISCGIFALTEWLFESQVIVTTTVTTTLESWQMYMCYVPPEGFETRTWTEVNVLMGEYSPTFKIHFYMISAVVILSLLNCFYGFAAMIRNNDKTKLKALIMQSVSSVAFVGMCIWACFTAFYRTGELQVSALSAVLMIAFFLLLGVTIGIFTGSFLLGKRKLFSKVIPSLAASAVTLGMYIGEMCLLSSNLYRFGTGFLFSGIPGISLAPIDIIVIIASGVITYLLLILANKQR